MFWEFEQLQKKSSGSNSIDQILSPGYEMPLEKLPKKPVFLGYLSQMWVGGVADSQTRSKPLKKKNQIAPKIAFFDPNFTFRFPKSHKNPGVGGWENRFGKDIQKNVFFGSFP